MQLKTLFRKTTTRTELACAQATSYAHWRAASRGVAEAYRIWALAPRNVRWLAHAAYLTALDHEEHAARAYQRRVEQVASSYSRNDRIRPAAGSTSPSSARR
jgi:hypothetical protein